MAYRDQLLRCGACGKEFVYTVHEQRQRKAQGISTDPPAFCSDCRVADVRLAEAAGPAAPEEQKSDEPAAPADDASSKRRNGRSRRPQRSKKKPRGKKRGRKDAKKGGGRATRQKQTDLRVRHVGSVKYFNQQKGYGFIASDDEGEVFVHLSGMIDDNVRSLEVGSPVEFEIEHTSRGPQAVDVIQLA